MHCELIAWLKLSAGEPLSGGWCDMVHIYPNNVEEQTGPKEIAGRFHPEQHGKPLGPTLFTNREIEDMVTRW